MAKCKALTGTAVKVLSITHCSCNYCYTSVVSMRCGVHVLLYSGGRLYAEHARTSHAVP